MSNVTTEHWAISQHKNPNRGDRGSWGHRFLEVFIERTCANPKGQQHRRGAHEKFVKFSLMVLVSTLEFPPTRCVTQFSKGWKLVF